MLKEKGPDASRAAGLDLLRSIAILLVVCWHLPWQSLPQFLAPVKRMGWTGVDLFFVLSGYLIGSQLMRPYKQGRKPSFRTFYFRRAMRVLPAYLFVLAVYFTIPVFREQPAIPSVWRFLTFTQNFGLMVYVKGAFSHAWSLCVEEHFYLVLPAIVFLLMKKPRLAKAAFLVSFIVVLGFGIRWFLWVRYLSPLGSSPDDQLFAGLYLEKIYYPTYTRLDGLLVGVVIAAVQLFRPDWWKLATRRGNALCAAGIVVLFLSYPICSHIDSFFTALFGYPMLAIGFGLLVAASASGNGLLARSRVWGATSCATLAYGIYLTHKQVMHLDRIYLGRFFSMDGVFGAIVYLMSIVAVAVLLHICVERPFLQARDRLASRQSKQLVVGASS